MNTTFIASLLFTLCLASVGSFRLEAQEKQTPSRQHAADTDDRSKDVFGPYGFLIGEWDVRSTDSGPVVAVQRVRWGPNRSYIWYAVSLISEGREEPPLEGLLVWNGARKKLDMLFVVDLKSGLVQEQGVMSPTSDGGLVRDIIAVYSAGTGPMGSPPMGQNGGTTHFRQSYTKVHSDKIATSVMRETDHGWVASFPGSDHLVMTRRSG
jgi:hypothetical protein